MKTNRVNINFPFFKVVCVWPKDLAHQRQNIKMLHSQFIWTILSDWSTGLINSALHFTFNCTAVQKHLVFLKPSMYSKGLRAASQHLSPGPVPSLLLFATISSTLFFPVTMTASWQHYRILFILMIWLRAGAQRTVKVQRKAEAAERRKERSKGQLHGALARFRLCPAGPWLCGQCPYWAHSGQKDERLPAEE